MTKASLVIALDADSLANLIFELLSRPHPLDRDDVKIILGRLLLFVKRYGLLWAISHTAP